MNEVYVARAPGKLFILGEYAVLDGCPAVVAAVGRSVRVTLRRHAASTPRVRLTARDHGHADFATTEVPPARGPLRFAIAAYGAVSRHCPALRAEGCTIDIDSELDQPPQTKIGLGSSAAVTVAVAAAAFAAGGRTPAVGGFRRELLVTALGAHRAAQDDVGSGADVAASVWGGLVRFDRGGSAIPYIVPLPLPRDTHVLVGWSGNAADTPDLIRRYRAAIDADSARRRTFLRSARACVEGFVDALAHGTVSLDAADTYGRLLEDLAADLDLPLLTPALRELLRIARGHGAAAKIAGGGGGDCGIALTRDATTAARILEDWRASGIVPLPLGVSSAGVDVALH